MALKDDIALLGQVPVFSGLEDEHLRLLAFGAERRTLDDGQVLFREKSAADCAFVVVNGTLALSGTDRSGETVDHGLASTATMLSELAMIMPTERHLTAVAAGPVEVIRITRALFHRMVEEYPDVGKMTETRLRARFSGLANALDKLSGRIDRP